MKILVTTLGKASKGYDTLSYQFADGHIVTSDFFVQALLEYKRYKGLQPDKVLVLGTSSSMWDRLLQLTDDNDEELFEKLMQDSEKDMVSKDTLKHLSEVLSKSMNVEFVCELVPLGVDEQQQAEVLQVIAQQIPPRATVTFDMTHGFRTLPLLQLLAIFYLKQIQNATISNIYYGAAGMIKDDNDKTITPVVKMDFVQKMLDWLTTLPLVEVTGRYGQLKNLLPKDELLANELEKYSLCLRTNQTESAHQSAGEIDQLLQKSFANPSAELYRETLRKKFNWSKRQSLAEWQILLAQSALRFGDLLRAVLLLREARISVAMKPEEQANRKLRDAMEKKLNSETDLDDEVLLALRNSLAHAGKLPKNKAGKIAGQWLQDETLLKKELRMIADKMFQKVDQAKHTNN